jgi:lysophospholipase L1-like esterase
MNAVYTNDDETETLGNKLSDIDNKIDDNVNKIGVLNTSLSEITNRFQTKKYVAVGDSITVGFVPKPYATLVGEQCNLQVVNLGISGSSMGENGTSPSPVCDRLNTIPSDASIISIVVGTNDFGYNTPIGMSGDTSNTTFYGATRNVCEYLQANFTNAQVYNL